jgi:secreted trypsin-like serine protease
MHMRIKEVFLALSFPLAISACAPEEEHTESASQEIMGGTADAYHPWVGAIETSDPNGSRPAVTCSGTLIHPRVVLTARHCIDGSRIARGFYVGSNVDGLTAHRGNMHRVRVVGSQFNPAGTFDFNGIDVALLFLGNDAPSPIAHLPGATGSIGGSALTIGFGTSTLSGNDAATGIIRRAAFSQIDLMNENVYANLDDPSRACPGDSGGPLMVDAGDGFSYVLGVTSEIRDGTQSAGRACGTGTTWTRIDLQSAPGQWVQANMGNWVSYVDF